MPDEQFFTSIQRNGYTTQFPCCADSLDSLCLCLQFGCHCTNDLMPNNSVNIGNLSYFESNDSNDHIPCKCVHANCTMRSVAVKRKKKFNDNLKCERWKVIWCTVMPIYKEQTKFQATQFIQIIKNTERRFYGRKDAIEQWQGQREIERRKHIIIKKKSDNISQPRCYTIHYNNKH